MRIKKIITKKYFLILTTVLMLFPSLSFAINYTPLSGETNPLLEGAGGDNLGELFNNLFQWGIGIAIVLAIVMIIFGGIQYMTTDAISNKEEGKGKIRNAVYGLLLALGAWLILNTINPAILNPRLDFGVIGEGARDLVRGDGDGGAGGGGTSQDQTTEGGEENFNQREILEQRKKDLESLKLETEALLLAGKASGELTAEEIAEVEQFLSTLNNTITTIDSTIQLMDPNEERDLRDVLEERKKTHNPTAEEIAEAEKYISDIEALSRQAQDMLVFGQRNLPTTSRSVPTSFIQTISNTTDPKEKEALVRGFFKNQGIGINVGPENITTTQVRDLRPGTIAGALELNSLLDNRGFVITGGSEAFPHVRGTIDKPYTHDNGYKIDISRNSNPAIYEDVKKVLRQYTGENFGPGELPSGRKIHVIDESGHVDILFY